jgi:hypothetical protein
MPPTSTQKLTVLFAFVAAALSLIAVGVAYVRSGDVATTPLFGGLLMLALGIAGVAKLRRNP